MSLILKSAVLVAMAAVLSGCVTAGAIMANEDVQDMAIDGVADILDL